MKPAFLVDLRVYRDYLIRTFRVALVISLFEILALQTLVPVPGLMGTIMLMGCAQTGLVSDQHGWECARLTMPISRSQVVRARYAICAVVGLAATLLGLVMCLVVGLVASCLNLPAERAAAFALSADNLAAMGLSTAVILLVGCVLVGILLAVGFKLGMTKTTQQLPFIFLLVTLVPLILLSGLGMMDGSTLDPLVSWLDGLFSQPWACPVVLVLAAGVLVLTSQLAVRFYEARDL